MPFKRDFKNAYLEVADLFNYYNNNTISWKAQKENLSNYNQKDFSEFGYLSGLFTCYMSVGFTFLLLPTTLYLSQYAGVKNGNN
ncbi:hypothetical protein ACFL1H_01765 [Nanoarchaeota archaeon]